MPEDSERYNKNKLDTNTFFVINVTLRNKFYLNCYKHSLRRLTIIDNTTVVNVNHLLENYRCTSKDFPAKLNTIHGPQEINKYTRFIRIASAHVNYFSELHHFRCNLKSTSTVSKDKRTNSVKTGATYSLVSISMKNFYRINSITLSR